jgi:hypothetical protein
VLDDAVALLVALIEAAALTTTFAFELNEDEALISAATCLNLCPLAVTVEEAATVAPASLMRPPSAVTKALALIAAEAFATTCAAAEADDEAAIVALAS